MSQALGRHGKWLIFNPDLLGSKPQAATLYNFCSHCYHVVQTSLSLMKPSENRTAECAVDPSIAKGLLCHSDA